MNLIRTIAFCLSLVGIISPAIGAENPTEMARAASDALRKATVQLEAAVSADDRIHALTATIRAFENGLVAMREGLRAAAVRERVLRKDFDGRRDQISRLLGVLQTMERATTPLLLMHPEGALGTARSGMMVSEVTPGLQAQAAKLKSELEELHSIQGLQRSAEEDLLLSLDGVQKARVTLSEAVSRRESLPKRFADDPIRVQILADNSDNLHYFADALIAVPFAELEDPPEPFSNAKGKLPLPVSGTLLRGFNDADAAGLTRPGILVATPALSLVTAPWDATVRYAGPFLDYGNVIILEPDVGYLIVLAGLERLYSKIGDIIGQGEPLGLLGGQAAHVGDFLVEASDGANTLRQETLYIEIRQNGKPVDPSIWFTLDRN